MGEANFYYFTCLKSVWRRSVIVDVMPGSRSRRQPIMDSSRLNRKALRLLQTSVVGQTLLERHLTLIAFYEGFRTSSLSARHQVAHQWHCPGLNAAAFQVAPSSVPILFSDFNVVT